MATNDRMVLLEELRKYLVADKDKDFLREVVTVAVNSLMDSEVKALLNVVQEAYIHGVSTRKVDVLVEALGMKGIDKSQVSRISKQLDDFVEEFRNRN